MELVKAKTRSEDPCCRHRREARTAHVVTERRELDDGLRWCRSRWLQGARRLDLQRLHGADQPRPSVEMLRLRPIPTRRSFGSGSAHELQCKSARKRGAKIVARSRLPHSLIAAASQQRGHCSRRSHRGHLGSNDQQGIWHAPQDIGTFREITSLQGVGHGRASSRVPVACRSAHSRVQTSSSGPPPRPAPRGRHEFGPRHGNYSSRFALAHASRDGRNGGWCSIHDLQPRLPYR